MKRPISAYFSALAMLWFLSSSTATETRRLLNAYRSNLSSLTAPNSFYFLEFPLDDVLGYKNNGVQPICGNGTPYSFMFRRGSDKHISKLLVEFEGGPACWGEGSESCCDPNNPARLEAPWYGYLQKKEIEVIKTGQFPSLSSCRGIPAGFAKASSATYLVGQNNSDVPIALRSNAGGRNNDWWQTLGIKDGSDISDWSYILLPHCTLDWHLGFQENRQQTGCGSNEQIYHRGGANARAVLDWVKTQFPSGLDALVTISGGKIGGCPNTASSIAPAYFAMEAAMGIRHAPPSSMLVVAEGSILWNKNILPNHAKMIHTWNIKNLVPRGGLSGTVEYMVLNSPDALQFAWIASENGGTIEERTWTTRIKTTSPENFHVYVPNAVSQQETCPRFALPKEEQQFSDVMLSEFFSDIVYNHMSWASRSSSTITKKSPIFSNNEDPEDSNTKSSLRLSFLSVSVLFITLAILAWVWYFTLRAHRFRNDLPAPSSPTDLWFTALTYYPRLFLLVSVLLPITLSYIAFSKSGYKINVNLDFDTYLDIQTDLDSVAKSYAGLQEYQEESSVLETQNCLTLWNGIRQNDYYRHLDELSFISNIEEEPNYPLTERDLQAFYDGKYAFRSNGQLISIIYRNRRGGNVFQPEVLKSIRQFEQSILKFPGFTDYCFRLVGDRKCLPFGSLANNFFQYGRLVIDINNVLRSFLGDPQALWKMDQYFGPNNLQSNITKTFIWLKDVGGDQSAANPFLERLYRDLLWKVQKEQLYPELEITWSNLYLEKLEANDALHHDVLWSICSLGFIGLMIFLKVRDGFVFLFSLLGLLLSFFTAFYWVSVHFNIEEITLLHVSSLFVMLGIGADDIFLMLDSFDHTRVMSRFYIKADESDDNDEGEESMERQQRQADIIRERMKSAYTTAGSMMLVSSMTTATCFFSNAFGVLVVIQEFGIYMGMVVLVNYLHVMTILPSAILVNELYFLPWKTRLWNKYVVQQRITREAKTGDIVNEKYQTDTEGVLKRHVSIGSEDNESNDDLSLHPREDLGSTKDGEGGSTKSLASSESSGEHGELNDIFKDTSRLKRMDRWLLKVHAPFIIKRPLFVVFFTVSLALILGCLGAINFEMADGAIVIFSEKYNIGRLNAINDEYFNGDLSQTIDISDVVGAGMGGNGSAGNGGSGSENQGSPGTPATQPSPSNSAPTPIPVKQPIVSSTMNPANRPTESPNSASNVAMTSGQQAQGTGSNTNASPSPRPACPKPCQNGGTCTFKGTCYCSNGWSGPYCEITTTPTRPPQLVPDTGLKLARKEMIVVKLIWGVEPVKKSVSDLWLIERKNTPPQEESPSYFGKQALPSIPGGVVNSFDLSEPQMQEWLLKVVKLARADDKLNVQPKVLTWIEMFHDVAIKSGVGFPVPKDLFAGYLQLLKSQNRSFFTLIKKEIGTRSPGLAGDFLFASITLHADVLRTNGSSLSMTSFKGWSSFAENVNELSPPGIPQMLAQSDTFLNAYRAEKTIDSTVTTWFVANGLCMAIILLFTQNVLLCAMVMVSIILIFLCLVGLVFAVFALPFGPVEALGISIFIGLSANYSLHLVHAYHRSSSSVREEKAKQAIFVTGSPILASALSTIGGSMFLFACRTWAFVELGILLCSIILMALLFSMTFLLAWLATKGPTPLPCEEQDKNKQRRRLHSCDLKALCYSSFRNFAGIKIGEKERPLSEVSKDYDGSANEEEPSICDSDVETSRKVERYPGRQ